MKCLDWFIKQRAQRPSKTVTLSHLRRLVPLAIHAEQTADGTQKTDNAIVQVSNVQSSEWDAQVAEVRNELDLGVVPFPIVSRQHVTRNHNSPFHQNSLLHLLDLDRLLPGLRLFGRLELHGIQPVNAVHDGEQQAHHPRLVRLPLELLHRRAGPDPRRVQIGQGVQAHVEGVTELPADGAEADDGVHGCGVGGGGGGAEVLDELTQAHGLAHAAHVLLQLLEEVDARLRVIGPVEVPCQEARQVLDRAEDLVATDCANACVSRVCSRSSDRGRMELWGLGVRACSS